MKNLEFKGNRAALKQYIKKMRLDPPNGTKLLVKGFSDQDSICIAESINARLQNNLQGQNMVGKRIRIMSSEHVKRENK